MNSTSNKSQHIRHNTFPVSTVRNLFVTISCFSITHNNHHFELIQLYKKPFCVFSFHLLLLSLQCFCFWRHTRVLLYFLFRTQIITCKTFRVFAFLFFGDFFSSLHRWTELLWLLLYSNYTPNIAIFPFQPVILTFSFTYDSTAGNMVKSPAREIEPQQS